MILNKEPHLLTKIKEADNIDTNLLPKTSREEATTINTAVDADDPPVAAKISSRVDAKSEAERQNIVRWAAILAKERHLSRDQ